MISRITTVGTNLSLRVPNGNSTSGRRVIRTIGRNHLRRSALGHSTLHILGVTRHCNRPAIPTSRCSVRTRRRFTQRLTSSDVMLLGGRGGRLPLDGSTGLTMVNRLTRGPHFRNNNDSRIGTRHIIAPGRIVPRGTDCTRNCQLSDSRSSRRLAGRTLRLTGGDSRIIFFTKFPRTVRSRNFSGGSVDLPTGRGRLVSRLLTIGTGMVIMLRGNSTIRVP